jgi:hypothetical protein
MSDRMEGKGRKGKSGKLKQAKSGKLGKGKSGKLKQKLKQEKWKAGKGKR